MRVRLFSGLLALAVLFGGAVFATGSQPSDPVVDPAAYALLKDAHDHRDAFPAGFAGLSAEIALNDNGKEAKGTLTYAADGTLTVSLNDASPEAEKWTHEQISSALGHRRSEEFARGDGSHPITFTSDDHSPLGRQVSLNDELKSLYRVKDGQITEVTRSIGPMRFTITVLENRVVEGGKYLPKQFVVTYFDAKTGAIRTVDEFSDSYAKVNGAWVPVSRRVVTAKDGGFVTRVITLSHVRLSGATASAKP